jgi:hypothetical protein
LYFARLPLLKIQKCLYARELAVPNYPIVLGIPSEIGREYGPSIANEFRVMIEKCVNARSRDTTVTVLNYNVIADDLGISKEIAKRFLAPVGGGSNGITIHNHDELV